MYYPQNPHDSSSVNKVLALEESAKVEDLPDAESEERREHEPREVLHAFVCRYYGVNKAERQREARACESGRRRDEMGERNGG